MNFVDSWRSALLPRYRQALHDLDCVAGEGHKVRVAKKNLGRRPEIPQWFGENTSAF
jgi:hypothetical protein